MTEPRSTVDLSVCCITRGPSGRVARQLSLLRDAAAEIVVAVDDRVDPDLVAPLVEVADEIVLYPYDDPVDRPVGWVHSLCRGDWILWVDDDELPSAQLLAELDALLRAPDVTHYWLPRRWLYRDARSMLDEAPWTPDYQLRLVRNAPALLWFPGITHWPIEAVGPHRYLEAPLYHTDLLLNPLERRREKARRYERLLPGKRVAGLPLNHALYLPEDRRRVALAPVPEEDAVRIEAALAGDPWGPPTRPASGLRRATRAEVDLHWHGRPLAAADYRARLEPVREQHSLAARETRALDVRITNDGTRTWPPGTLGWPELRVSYRWRSAAGAQDAGEGLRTPLPHAVGPGATALVPVYVTAPPRPGSYVLEVDMVHEHVRWFGSPTVLPIEVTSQPLVLIAGADEGTRAELAATIGESVPGVEPAYVGTAGGADGYRTLPGARSYVLEGGRASRPATLWRAVQVLLAARRARRGVRPTAAAEYLAQLTDVDLVLDLGRQRDRRERLQHRAAMGAARALGIPVVDVSGADEALRAVRGVLQR